MANECGECTLCCKLQGIHELDKPVNKWCTHAAPGKGCNIYDTKPPSCTDYRCLWLAYDLEADLRPDRSKVIFEGVGEEVDHILMRVAPETYTAPLRTPVTNFIDSMLKNGVNVLVTDGHRSRMLCDDATLLNRWGFGGDIGK